MVSADPLATALGINLAAAGTDRDDRSWRPAGAVRLHPRGGRAPRATARHDDPVGTDSDMPQAAPRERPGALEIRGAGSGLLDDPLTLRARGAGADTRLLWRARLRDDDGRVWRAVSRRAEDLPSAWAPAKAGTGPLAALQSLHPVAIDVRVEAPDGRSAARRLTHRVLAEGVQVRRWRGDLAARLYLPVDGPASALIIDATAGPGHVAVAALAAALLASRGVLVLAVGPGRGKAAPAAVLAEAGGRLSAVPAAAGADVHVLPALDLAAAAGPSGDVVVLPPGVPVTEEPAQAAARAAAWDALLARLGASPRESADR
jgi:hypothetical protein